MISRAKVRGMIPYSDLVKGVKRITLEPHDPRLFHMLGEISSAEDAVGRGMLTVVVVHKIGDMQPGPGFFELAKQLRRMACTRFRGHRVRCFDGTGGVSWRDGSLHASSSLRLCG
jgi:hypothetical protein